MHHCVLCLHNIGQSYQAAYVTILSCFANTSAKLHVHLVVDESVAPYRHFFQELCDSRGHRLTFHDAPAIPDDIMAFFPGDSLEKYSSASLWRLQLHEMLPDVDKVVYLDGDIVVERDILDLFSLEPGTRLIIATHDPERRWSRRKRGYYLKRLGIVESRYFNSGVMVMNLKALRQRALAVGGNPFWLFTRELHKRHPNLPYHLYDQDILNAYLSPDEEALGLADSSFNYEVCLFRRRFMKMKDLRGKIIHYAALKPWGKFFPAQFPYWHYFTQSPWGSETMQRLEERIFDPHDRIMPMMLGIWRNPALFRPIWKILRPFLK
ncbi:MAG TPA: hypothetical protein H9991_01920 [Candidatus Mailhella excrementigallinarum]|nr:MAG: hypothetical protein DBY37_05120 [Desulfovibrionaceae bacterium]HIV64993.1 hypothetical protein [Candidatus Mailhella excrementigallinarum]